jgi:glycosyltransferase involved in cell wall biosynthesis
MSREILIPADIRFPLERANGVQIVKTAAALAGRGARVTLLVRESDPRPTAEILGLYGLGEARGLAVRRVDVGHRRGAFALPRLLFLGRALAAGLAALRRGAFVYTRDLQLADLLLALRPAARVAYEAHAVEAILYRERGRLYGTSELPSASKAARLARREARVWRRAAAIVTTTAGISDSFRSESGPRERVAVIPNGCDAQPGEPFPGLANGEPPRVLYAGQLYPWKGVDVLVEAIATVPGARLAILGGLAGEPDFERIARLVREHGLSERTEMPGTVPQARVAGQLRDAAAVAVPFLHSGMTERHTSPLKAFEAMAAGRPIVASDLPSTREILRPDETALLAPPGDARALGGALRRLLGDRPLAERLARAAYAEAARYAWSARAERLLRLFEEAA